MAKDVKFLISIFSLIAVIATTTVILYFHTELNPNNLEHHWEIKEDFFKYNNPSDEFEGTKI